MLFSQVFCYVAQRLGAEGADKTWDQCRIKLKNLKSQYRYVKVALFPTFSKILFKNKYLFFNRSASPTSPL